MRSRPSPWLIPIFEDADPIVLHDESVETGIRDEGVVADRRSLASMNVDTHLTAAADRAPSALAARAQHIRPCG